MRSSSKFKTGSVSHFSRPALAAVGGARPKAVRSVGRLLPRQTTGDAGCDSGATVEVGEGSQIKCTPLHVTPYALPINQPCEIRERK